VLELGADEYSRSKRALRYVREPHWAIRICTFTISSPLANYFYRGSLPTGRLGRAPVPFPPSGAGVVFAQHTTTARYLRQAYRSKIENYVHDCG